MQLLYNPFLLVIRDRSRRVRVYPELRNEHHGFGKDTTITGPLHLRYIREPAIRANVPRPVHWSSNGCAFLYEHRQFSWTARLSHLRPTGEFDKSTVPNAQIQGLHRGTKN